MSHLLGGGGDHLSCLAEKFCMLSAAVIWQ